MTDYPLASTLYIMFTTRAFATGIPTVLAGTPVVSAYEDDSVTQITAGITLGVSHDSVVGLNLLTIVATGANGYETGKDYNLVITVGTVGGVSVVGEVVGRFTLDRSAAAQDLANGTDGLGAIKAETAAILVDTGTTLQGELDAIQAAVITNAAGADVAADVIALKAVADTVAADVRIVDYMGPNGPGVYLNDAAANTNTVFGTDGTVGNPVSTIAAAKTLADAQSLDRIYLVNNSDITLAATMTDYEFVGIGEITANVVNLGSQDVSRSTFYNVCLEGTQGGAGRILAIDCSLADPGAGDTTLHIFACRCGFVNRIQVDTSNDNIFDECYSLVAGTAAPVIQATGAAGTISVRHYSGGIEFETLSASHNVSVETDGQVIFAADCNVNANVSLHGNMTITDNTAGMNSLTVEAALNRSAIADQVWDETLTAHATADSASVHLKDILADTAEIGAAGAGLTALASQASVDVIDGIVDAILVDTDTTIPATIATVDTVVDAIKAKTDSLTYTVAGQVDANIQSVNDVTVTGDGAAGTEWGP